MLANIAELLAYQVRGSDMLARFGGETFCVLALNITENGGAEYYFERLRQLFEETPIETPSGPFNLTISIGVCDRIKGTLDEMISEADTQLYTAKRNGRNQVIIAAQ